MNTDYSELKPDYIRIATALRIDIEPITRVIPSPVSSSLNKSITFSRGESHLDAYWKILTNNKTSFVDECKEKLEKFLDEYRLSSSLNDFLFLAFYFTSRKSDAVVKRATEPLTLETRSQLISSLKMFFNNQLETFNIIIQKPRDASEKIILDPIFFDGIKNSLLSFFIEHVPRVKNEIHDLENFEDWSDYLEYVIDDEKIEKHKGRKPKHGFTITIIDALQLYLQEYTEIKTEMASVISNSQSSLIFKFLTLFKLIDSDPSYKEDTLRLLLKEYRAKKGY